MNQHLRWAVPLVLAVGVACTSAASPTPTPAQDAGSDADPCAGLGCAVGAPSLTLAVQDTSGTPVRSAYFSEGGKQLLFSCVLFDPDAGAGASDGGDAGDAGPGPLCAKWRMEFSVGKHAITVDAQGYVSQTFEVELKGPVGCCGQGDQVEKTLTLASQ